MRVPLEKLLVKLTVQRATPVVRAVEKNILGRNRECGRVYVFHPVAPYK